MIIAKATYASAWNGSLTVHLVAKNVTRRGQQVMVARWLDEHGQACDGVTQAMSPKQMIAHAKRHARFSNVQNVEA